MTVRRCATFRCLVRVYPSLDGIRRQTHRSPVNSLVANESAAVAALCHRYGVVRLDLFGSATTNAFDSARSDLDFLAEFAAPAPTVEYADRLLDFADALETLLKRRVDVVSATAIRGSRLADTIAATRQLVYAEPQPAAV